MNDAKSNAPILIAKIFKNYSIHKKSELYTSLAIFLFLAMSLAIPSGANVGPLLLLTGSVALLFNSEKTNIKKEHIKFIICLFCCFFIFLIDVILYQLPLRNLDLPTRYILAIPAFIFLISSPPKYQFYVFGAAIGALLSGIIAIYQIYILDFQRACGFTNPIQFGNISLILSTLTSLSLFRQTTKRSAIFKIFLTISVVLGFAASILSGSRGCWLAIMLLAFVYLNYTFKKNLLLFLALSITSATLLVSVITYNDAIKKRILVTTNEIKNYSMRNVEPSAMSIRLQMWQLGIKAFKEKPIFGWGNLQLVKDSFPSEWHNMNEWDPEFNHLHNDYVDTLAKRGLVGFCGLLAIYLIPLSYFAKSINLNASIAISGIFLVLLVMAFGLTQSFLAHINGITVYIFLILTLYSLLENPSA